nr:siderophore-interacting protein [Catenuloplanes japonicus]
MLAGDESALPAVLSILEGLPADSTGDVFLEVPSAADERTNLKKPPGVRVSWLARDDSSALAAVRESAVDADYAWVAGEAKLATGVRRHLVDERGMAKQHIAFMGYWRHGRASLG